MAWRPWLRRRLRRGECGASRAAGPIHKHWAVRKPWEAAVPVARANRRRASGNLDDARHRRRLPSCPAHRPRDLYGSILRTFGITPRANSSGGKERIGRISKMGDRYLRRLLVSGMTSQGRSVRRNPEAHPWATGPLRRKPAKPVAVAMANKAARTAWAVMTRDDICRAPKPATEEVP